MKSPSDTPVELLMNGSCTTGGKREQHQHERIDEERRRVHAVADEERQLDREDGPGDERRRPRGGSSAADDPVRTQIVPIQTVCATKPAIIMPRAMCCGRFSRVKSVASATTRSGGVQRERSVEGQVAGSCQLGVSFLQKTTLSSSIR